jgi:hypothetical protein
VEIKGLFSQLVFLIYKKEEKRRIDAQEPKGRAPSALAFIYLYFINPHHLNSREHS